MKSIKTRLIISFCIMILISTAVLAFISLERAGGSLTEEAEAALRSIAVESSKLTESRVETQKQALRIIAMMPDIEDMDWEKQLPILQGMVQKTNFIDIGILYPEGTAYFSDGTAARLGDEEFVLRALKGDVVVSDLIVSNEYNEPILYYAAPIESNGKVVGVVMGKRSGMALSNITDEISFGEGGYAYMINTSGTIVAHQDRERVLNRVNPIAEANNDESLVSVAQLFTEVIQEKSGVSSYTYMGNDLYVGYSPINGTSWILVITADKQDVLAAIPLIQRDIVIAASIILLCALVISFIVGSSITKPVIHAIRHSENIARLDLTQEVPHSLLSKKDEVGLLAKALQNITDSLREIIEEINMSSQQVTSASEELTATSQQSATSAEEITKTINAISEGAFHQVNSVNNGTEKANILGNAIEMDSQHLQGLNAATKKASEAVKIGLTEINALLTITNDSDAAIKEIQEVVLKSNESSRNIEEASNFITEIANKTNLLALNAAIEAARAGDAGRGFAVVAEEIRGLAEQSTASTKSIDEIVKELQSNTDNVVKTMDKVSTIAQKQNRSVIASREKYLLIAEAMNSAEETVNLLNLSGEDMEGMKREILLALKELASIAENNSAATEEATASMEEQSASIEEIASASEGLAQLAQSLHAIITRFKL